MAEQRKYFSFHKKMDFERGVFENMRAEDDGLFADALSYKDKSLFFSRILDSGEEKMAWHRLTLAAENEQAATYRISVYASDEPFLVEGNRRRRMEEILSDRQLSSEEKIKKFRPFLKKRASAGRDLWLHEVRGRYLWFVLEVFAQGRGILAEAQRKDFGVKEIMVYFPAQSWMQYLPELYQEADMGQGFLERYLGIFQSLYEDINHAIYRVPEEFSIDAAQGNFLYFLASMLDWKDTYVWTKEQLRRLLKNVIMLYRFRGTRESISWLIELYTGEKPYILEYRQLLPFWNDRSGQLFLRLYGNDPYVVNIFLRESAMPTEKEYKTILRMLDEIRPAQTSIRLVALKPYIFLGEHSYLGVNSVLGQYRDITLDGVLAVPFAVIGS